MKKLILSSLFMTILSTAALATPSSLEGVTSRVATNTDKLTDFALGKLQGLFDATTKAIPTVTKYTLQVTQIGCIADLFQTLIPTIILIMSVCAFKFFKKMDKDKLSCDGEMGRFLGMLASALAGIASLIGILVCLSQFWLWVCIVHPDIYLIHLAVQKVLG